MRLAGRMRLGFFPLPTAEAKRVQRFLQFPDQNCSALDPCIGEGVAFSQIASGEKVLRYGIELEANRAEAARAVVNALIQGNCFGALVSRTRLPLVETQRRARSGDSSATHRRMQLRSFCAIPRCSRLPPY